MIKIGHELTNEEIAKRYDTIHSTIREPETHYRNVVEELRNDHYGTLLEIGCGQGKLLKRLRMNSISRDYYGLDINDSFVNESRKWIIDPEKIQKGSVYSIPFLGKSFDTIVLMDVIEHLKYPDDALKEIHSRMNSDGSLILTVPNASAFEPTRRLGEKSKNKLLRYLFLSWEHPLKSKQPIDTMIYYHEYVKLFNDAGFTIASMKGWNYYPYLYTFPKINQIVDWLLSPLWGLFDKLEMQDKAYSLLFILKPKQTI